MGFWDVVGSVAKSAGKAAVDASDRVKQYKEEMPSKSDRELVKIIKEDRISSPLRAGAANKELKDRGYSPEDINLMLR